MEIDPQKLKFLEALKNKKMEQRAGGLIVPTEPASETAVARPMPDRMGVGDEFTIGKWRFRVRKVTKRDVVIRRIA